MDPDFVDECAVGRAEVFDEVSLVEENDRRVEGRGRIVRDDDVIVARAPERYTL